MSLIKNLIKEPENKSHSNKSNKEKGATDEELEAEKKARPIIKTATDLQRLKLEKLMKNPEKPVNIPDAPRERDHMQTVPSFVRNVMGSSAGAGSGEFHVYRHLRRKEYARQKTIQAKSIREQLDDEYQQKLDDNRRLAEDKTAKKRAKRLKKKQRSGKKPKRTKTDNTTHEDSTDEEEEEVEALQEEEVEALQDEAADDQPDNVKESEIVKTQSKEYIKDNELVQCDEEKTQEDTDLTNEKNKKEPNVITTEILELNEVATTMKLPSENKIELLESEDNVCDKSNGE